MKPERKKPKIWNCSRWPVLSLLASSGQFGFFLPVKVLFRHSASLLIVAKDTVIEYPAQQRESVSRISTCGSNYTCCKLV